MSLGQITLLLMLTDASSRCKAKSNTYPGTPVSTSMSQLKAFKKAILAPSTCRIYNIGIKKFYMFCENFNFMTFPLNEEVLCLFATNLAESVSFKIFKLYLSAVKFQNIELGFIDSMSKMTQLQLALHGIKQTLGVQWACKAPCLPVSIVTMMLLKWYICRSNLTNHNKLMFWSACTLAFFGFLQSSEYVTTSASNYSKDRTLLHQDVLIKRGHIHLTIKASKTDPFQEGVTLLIAPTHHSICPVHALKWYLAKSSFHSGPLYKHKNGKCLTCLEVSRVINQRF